MKCHGVSTCWRTAETSVHTRTRTHTPHVHASAQSANDEHHVRRREKEVRKKKSSGRRRARYNTRALHTHVQTRGAPQRRLARGGVLKSSWRRFLSEVEFESDGHVVGL